MRFADSWKRIERARMHGKACTAEWNRVLDPKSSSTEVYRKDEGTYAAKMVFPLISDNDFALELGEFFYQLMAALDGVVFQATVLEGEIDPPANVDGLYFPLAKKLRSFNESAFSNGPLSQDIKYWIESIQPYNAGKAKNADDELMIRALTNLHTCARKDRHRRLHLMAAVPTAVKYDFEFKGGSGKISFERVLDANFFEDKCDFLEFGVEGDATEIKLVSGVRVEIRMDEIPLRPGEDLATELNRMTTAVVNIVQFFENWFE